MQVIEKARQRPALSLIVAVLALALLGLASWWFGPQKLLLDETASDRLPVAGGRGLVALAQGSFVSLAHETTGSARIVPTDDGPVLRFDDLDSLNGPDLVVYLSSQAASDDPAGFDDTLVADLGTLRANRGDLNIAIPPTTDLAEVRSVVIWCRRFTVAFGAADLTPVG